LTETPPKTYHRRRCLRRPPPLITSTPGREPARSPGATIGRTRSITARGREPEPRRPLRCVCHRAGGGTRGDGGGVPGATRGAGHDARPPSYRPSRSSTPATSTPARTSSRWARSSTSSSPAAGPTAATATGASGRRSAQATGSRCAHWCPTSPPNGARGGPRPLRRARRAAPSGRARRPRVVGLEPPRRPGPDRALHRAGGRGRGAEATLAPARGGVAYRAVTQRSDPSAASPLHPQGVDTSPRRARSPLHLSYRRRSAGRSGVLPRTHALPRRPRPRSVPDRGPRAVSAADRRGHRGARIALAQRIEEGLHYRLHAALDEAESTTNGDSR